MSVEKEVNTAKKTSSFNWLIPAILFIIATGFLLFYPAPNPKTDNPRPTAVPSTESSNQNFSSSDIANTLVATFFNGSEQDRKEQIRALKNTIDHLTKTEETKQIRTDLRNNQINAAIDNLIARANKQINQRESAKTWINIGNIQNLTSAEQALQAYQKASELDPYNSDAWNRQGHIHRQLKQFSEAEIAYKKVQSLSNQSTANQAFSLANFGLLNQSKGDFEAAEKAFIEALDIYTKINNDAGIVSTSENLASLYKNNKELEKAESYYLKILEIHQKQETPKSIATTHAALGSLYQAMKKNEKAQAHYEQALEISLNNNFSANIASLYSNLGILAKQNGQLIKSKEYFERSLSLNKDIKRSIGMADQYGNLAIINRTKKEFAIAENYHLRAIEIYKENKHQNGVISQQTNLGFLYKAWNKPEKACEAWKSSLQLLRQDRNKRAERIKQLIQSTCP